MTEVRLPTALLAQMRSHAREVYPDECCGFLIGPTDDGKPETPRTIHSLERARNEFDGERRRRFLILPEELREVDRRAEGEGRVVVGFYHSHPDHPARPSVYDQEHAWPWYSYIVLSVTGDATPAVGAFELDPDSSIFHEVALRIEGEATLSANVVGW